MSATWEAQAWVDFLAAEAAARSARNATWNGLNPADPVSSMQGAWDAYEGIYETAFANVQGVLGTAIQQFQDAASAAFASFQSILGGAGTVADGLTGGASMDDDLDEADTLHGARLSFADGGTAAAAVAGTYLGSARVYGAHVEYVFHPSPGEVQGSKKLGFRGRRLDVELLVFATSEANAVAQCANSARLLARCPGTFELYGHEFNGAVLESSSTSQPSKTGFGTYRAVAYFRFNALRLDEGEVDRAAVRLVPTFGSTVYPKSQASLVRHSYGPNPGVALVDIPLKDLDETGPNVVCVANSPWTDIKGFSIAKVSALGATLMYGQVASKDGTLDGDTMSVEILDGRWALARLQVVGSIWAVGLTTGEGEEETTYLYDVGFRQGWPAIFNPNGEPNCYGAEGGTIPAFCLPRYGLEPGETAAADLAESEANKKACYWTPALILQYLRYYFKSASLAPFDYLNAHFPSWITWPTDLHEALTAEEDGEEDPVAINHRKGAPYSVAGKNLAQALSDVMRMAGPYDLGMTYSPEGNTIAAVRTRHPGGEAGTTLTRPVSGGAGGTLDGAGYILGGHYREDFRDTVTRVIVDGDLMQYEVRASMDNGETEGEEPEPLPTNLEPAWTAERAADWLDKYVLVKGSTGSHVRAFAAACRAVPEYGAAYRVKVSYDYTEHSQLNASNYPHNALTRPPLPKLLTSFLENASGVTWTERTQHHLPITVEVKTTFSSGAKKSWRNTNIGVDAIDDDGTIWLTTARDAELTLEVSGSTSIARDLRMTLALPGDNNVIAIFKNGVDPSIGTPLASGEMEHDEALLDSNASAALYIETQGLYRYEERIGAIGEGDPPVDAAWPIPQSVQGSTVGSGLKLVDDYASAEAHAKRTLLRLGRVQKSGWMTIKQIEVGWTVGLAVNDLSNGFGVKAMVAAIEWHGGTIQQTKLILG